MNLQNADSSRIRLAIHGGAGDLAPGAGPQTEHRAALHRIAASTKTLLMEGAKALDAVEHAVLMLEECPLFNAGIGGVLNRDGLPELDAAIQRGSDRACGAVAGVMRSQSPIRLARAVMERSPHVFFSGLGAEQLGRELGLPEVSPNYFVTTDRIVQLEAARLKGVITLDHDTDDSRVQKLDRSDAAFGTVGAVARDVFGGLAAATSTGGLTNKHPGRIGDTPMVGMGTFADDRSAAISCTGTGESFIKTCFGHEVHARMCYSGWDLVKATQHALEEVLRYGGRGGCIAIDREGRVTMPFNSYVMYRASIGSDGQILVAVEPD